MQRFGQPRCFNVPRRQWNPGTEEEPRENFACWGHGSFAVIIRERSGLIRQRLDEQTDGREFSGSYFCRCNVQKWGLKGSDEASRKVSHH